MVSTVMNAIGKVIKFILPMIFDTVKFYLNAVVNVFKGVFNIIAGVVKVFTALFSGDWKGMWAGIKQVLTGAVQAIWGLFNLWFVGKIAGVLGKFIGKGLGFISKFVGDGLKWFGKFVSEGFSKVGSFVTNIVSRIGTGMAQFGGVIARWLVKAVKSYIDFQINAVKAIAGMVSKMASIGVNVAKGLWEGIKSMGSWVAKQVKKWALSVIPASIADALGIHSPSRVTKKQGEYTAQGLADGITSKSKAVETAARSAAAKAKHGFEDGFRNIQYRVDAKKLNVDSAINELERLKAKYKSVPNAVERINKEIYKLNQDLAKKNAELYKQRFEAQKAQIQEQLDQNKISLTQELKEYENLQKHYKKGTEERKYWDQQVYNTKKAINDQLTTIDQEYSQKSQDINQKLKDDIKSVTDAYNQAVTDRTNSLYSFTGLFDEVTHASDVSGQQLIDNLKGQVDTFAQWADNIKSLSAKGIDQGLLKELQDMGPQAADQIAALNTLSAPQLDQYVASVLAKACFCFHKATY
jgi:phage-related protein